jgi:hypothetical protein
MSVWREGVCVDMGQDCIARDCMIYLDRGTRERFKVPAENVSVLYGGYSTYHSVSLSIIDLKSWQVQQPPLLAVFVALRVSRIPRPIYPYPPLASGLVNGER